MVDTQLDRRGFALDQDRDLAVLSDGVVDLLALLGADVATEFGDDFAGIEEVVPSAWMNGMTSAVFAASSVRSTSLCSRVFC
jgi:hypothetical protein